MFGKKSKRKPLSRESTELREQILRDAAAFKHAPDGRHRTPLQAYGDARDHYLFAPIRCYGDPRDIYLA